MQHALPILIIEDSNEDYEALVRAFARAGVSNPIYRFSYGEDAFDFLKQRGRFFKHGDDSRPAFVILDLNLPGTDGMKVLAEVRADPAIRGVPVIVFSTSSVDREVEQAYAAGANAYIVKPSNPDRLHEIIRRLKEFWLQTATLPSKRESLEIVVPPSRQSSPGGEPNDP